MSNSRGFTVPVVLIFTLVFLALPVAFWFYFNNSNASNIKGAADSNLSADVRVKLSASGMWELSSYLCTDKTECLSNLYSGKRLATYNGGKTDNQTIAVEKPLNTKDTSYIKLFAKPLTNKTNRFSITLPSDLDINTVEISSLEYENNSYSIILFPLKSFDQLSSGTKQIEFSNK